jgi:hypothetical protein
MNPRQISRVPMQRSAQIFRSQDGLVRLADQTGGLFFANNNDIGGEIRKAMQDSEGYYLIAYHPDASTFDPRTGRAKFHKVEVKVKRAGLKVRYRSGFLGNSDRYEKQVATTPQALIAHAMNSPFASGQIHVRLTGLFSYDPKTGPYLSTLLYIDANDLKFEDEPDGWHKATFDLVARTFDANGNSDDATDKAYTVRLKDDAYRNALKVGIVYSVPHRVKKPGPYQMRVAICDPNSDEVGSATQFVEVPDVSKGKLTLSSLMIREHDETKPAAAAPPAGATTPPAAATPVDENPNGTPAVRIFRAGHEIIYAYQILNAADSGGKPDLESQTRVFRDGEQIYEGKPLPLSVQDQKDPKYLLGAGAMRLGPAMKPGDYVLQVIVTDKTGGRNQSTSQSIDFQVE